MLSTAAIRRFVVPKYQRRYEWDEARWHDLWRDAGQLYLDRRKGLVPQPHFLGIALLAADSGVQTPRAHQIIDGQQRFITMLLLLAAIRDAEADAVGKSIDFLQHPLLYLSNEDGERTSERLITAQKADEVALDRALHGQWRAWFSNPASVPAGTALEAYTYFRYCIWLGEDSVTQPDPFDVPMPRSKAAKKLAAEQLWTDELKKSSPKATRTPLDLKILRKEVLDSLEVLVLSVEPGDEDPVIIFDAINGKRTEFNQWDHTRTFMFMRLGDKAENLLHTAWEPVEQSLDQVKYRGKTSSTYDQFVYDYLIARGEQKYQRVNKRRTHQQLKTRIRRLVAQEPSPSQLEDFLLNDFLHAAECFPAVVSENSIDRQLQRPSDLSKLTVSAASHLDQIRFLSAGPPNPACLHYLDAWFGGRITEDELDTALGMLESYLARHVLAGTEMSPFRARFMTMMGRLECSIDLADLAVELKKDSPTDVDVRAAHLAKPSPAYTDLNATQLAAIFRGIEVELSGPGSNPLPHGSKETDFSVEHIYPSSCQSQPNKDWEPELAAWGKLNPSETAQMGERVHSIGNLVLLSNKANKTLKASSFGAKLKAYKGADPNVKLPPLSHLHDVTQLTQWTSAEIDSHAIVMIEAALKHWSL